MYPEMTISEIETTYPDEWVLLSEPRLGSDGKVLAGQVVFHSREREAVYARDRDLRLPRAGYVFTGDWPADTVVVL